MSSINLHRCLSGLLCCLLLACDGESPPPANPAVQSQPGADSNLSLGRDDRERLAGIVQGYVRQVDLDFSSVSAAIIALQSEAADFLAAPGEEGLAAVRSAWTEANIAFEATALHRNFADTILSEDLALRFFQTEYRINHWPILPGYVDYVSSYPDSGIVNDMTVTLTTENLRAQHGVFDVDEVSLGYHVIEFLLWGEYEVEGNERTYSDYVPQTRLSEEQELDGMVIAELPTNRRRLLLSTAIQALQEDFQTLMAIWSAGSADYRLQLAQEPSAALASDLVRAMTTLLDEQLLARSLYPMLNGDFRESQPSIFSRTSQQAVSAQVSAMENLVLDSDAPDSSNLDTLFNKLSDDYAEFFLMNFDASKECLVILFSTDYRSMPAASSANEFKVVECINFLTNMVDYLRQIDSRLN